MLPGFQIGNRQFPLHHFSWAEAREFLQYALLVIVADIMQRRGLPIPDVDKGSVSDLPAAVALMTDNTVSQEWIRQNTRPEKLRELVLIQVQFDGMLDAAVSCLQRLNDWMAQRPQA